MYGKAADIHCGHAYDEELRDIAEECGAAGVGLYDTWMHVDIGTKRRWDYRTKKYKHYRQSGSDIIEIDPSQLSHVWMGGRDKRFPAELVKKYTNFVNCMFYGADDIPYRLLIQDGQIQSPFLSYDKQTDKGTMIIHSDGSVSVKTIGRNDLDSLDIAEVKLAFQGFNLNFEANGSTNLRDSMRKEGWGEPDDYIYNQNCYRPGFGYNPEKKKVIIAVKKTTAEGLRDLMRSLGCKTSTNDTNAIGGDGRGSIAFAVGGKLIHNGGRTQVSILKW
jgi:hypothetical protein